MVKLLIIADDFTGALDTGIQFAKRGVSTQVFNDFQFENDGIQSNTEVLVVDTESRHLPKEAAYQKVKDVANWAKKQGIEIVFKKTDSALRGNIGAELEAVVDAYQVENLFFMPGHPEIYRVIKNGTSYISGQLLENSVFGTDSYESPISSSLPEIINKQSDISVEVIGSGEKVNWEASLKPRIQVCDSIALDDIDNRLNELIQNNQIKYLAGCTALADCLADKISFNRTDQSFYEKTDGLYIACGSLNQITKKQVEYAEKNGFDRHSLTPLLESNHHEFRKAIQRKNKVIVDTFENDENNLNDKEKNSESQKDVNVRYTITEAHGNLAKEIIDGEKDYTILMTGGDTLMGLMKVINIKQIKLLCEIERGVVLSIMEYQGKKQQIISKSGGFGTEDVFCRIADKILKESQKEVTELE